MNKAIKRKWLKALRSGKYHRAMGVLKRPAVKFVGGEEIINGPRDKHCCLGVLCEVMGAGYDPGSAYLPRPLAKQVGLSREEDQRALAALNDGEELDDAVLGGRAMHIRRAQVTGYRRVIRFIEKYL